MHVNDCMYQALGGPPGQRNELFLAWLQAGGATSDNIMDAQREFLIAQGVPSGHLNNMWFEYLGVLGHTGALNDRFYKFWCGGGGDITPLPTLYVNPELSPGTIPPDGHSIGFGTVDHDLNPIAGLTDWWEFESNPDFELGRAYLTYQIDINNPDLVVGGSYRISWLVENVIGGSGGAVVTIAGANNVDTSYFNRNAVVGGGWTECGFDFTVEADPWTIQGRVGTGTASNQGNRVKVRFGKLVQTS